MLFFAFTLRQQVEDESQRECGRGGEGGTFRRVHTSRDVENVDRHTHTHTHVAQMGRN